MFSVAFQLLSTGFAYKWWSNLAETADNYIIQPCVIHFTFQQQSTPKPLLGLISFMCAPTASVMKVAEQKWCCERHSLGWGAELFGVHSRSLEVRCCRQIILQIQTLWLMSELNLLTKFQMQTSKGSLFANCLFWAKGQHNNLFMWFCFMYSLLSLSSSHSWFGQGSSWSCKHTITISIPSSEMLNKSLKPVRMPVHL